MNKDYLQKKHKIQKKKDREDKNKKCIISSDDPTVKNIFDNLDCERENLIMEITEKMNSGKIGINSNNILKGSDFKVNLNNCPDNWNDKDGVSDDKIKIRLSSPLSGNLSKYGNISVGMRIWFDYINKLNVLSGRNIDFIVKMNTSTKL